MARRKRYGYAWLIFKVQESRQGLDLDLTREQDPTFFSIDPDPNPGQLENSPDPTLNRNEEKNIFIF